MNADYLFTKLYGKKPKQERDFFIFVAFAIIFVIPVKSFTILVKSFESIKKAFHKCIFLHGKFRGGLRELFREITTQSPFYSAPSIFAVLEIWFEKSGSRNLV